MTYNCYKIAQGFLLLCDLSSRESFEKDLPRLKLDIEKYGPEKSPIVLIGTKSDLKQVVSIEEIQRLGELWGCQTLIVSSKTGLNVEKAVETVLNLIQHSIFRIPEENASSGFYSWITSFWK
jgi:GTPase SAR1 family protein